MGENYLDSVRKQFEYYKLLGEKTFDQLSEQELNWRHSNENNSISLIVKHLHGNMLSRWTDFLTSDGEKEWRKRDEEFEEESMPAVVMMERWEKGWQCLFAALQQLRTEDLGKTVYIRNQGQTVVDAINRQLAHYSYHVGQIVFLGKMLTGEKWTSLSIPRNKSKEYNSEKFAKNKHPEHFTDEYLKKKK